MRSEEIVSNYMCASTNNHPPSCTLFGMTEYPLCTPQATKTWASVAPSLLAMALTSGYSVNLAFPLTSRECLNGCSSTRHNYARLLPRGEYAVIWIFLSLQYATKSSCGNRGCASIWLTGGTIPVALISPSRTSTEKLETPTLRTLLYDMLVSRWFNRAITNLGKSIHSFPCFSEGDFTV